MSSVNDKIDEALDSVNLGDPPVDEATQLPTKSIILEDTQSFNSDHHEGRDSLYLLSSFELN